MGTGKNCVGERLARRLGMKFVDCDQLIEERAGKKISAIFEQEGEPEFRRVEREVVREVAAGRGLVVASGGGVLADPENVAHLRRSGILICLTARPEVIWERVRASRSRPLLSVADPQARIRELLAARAEHYAQADYQVDTSDLSIEEAVQRVMDLIRKVRVELGERSYDIIIEPGLLSQAGEEMAGLGEFSQVVVITNPTINRLYGRRVLGSLQGSGLKSVVLQVPAGERQKSLSRSGKLYDSLLKLGADRKSALLVLGGGVIGDLAGFVAATYMRGIDLIQVPTTLLAQVDSSVGGKVAVNHPGAKNLVGAFYQPRVVLIDPQVLATLPRRELRAGMAEVIKCGVVADGRLFEYLEGHLVDLLPVRRHGEPERAASRYVILRCCEIKAEVVGRDEREQSGYRAILNFGHTVGHAIEALIGYGRCRHGEAVAIGMAVAARLAERMGLWAGEAADRLIRLIEHARLPTRLPELPVDDVINTMWSDKKAVAGHLRMVLPVKLGAVKVVDEVPLELLREVLAESKETKG